MKRIFTIIAAFALSGSVLAGEKPSKPVTKTAQTVKPENRTVADVLKSLKKELVRMSGQFPELAGAKDIKIGDDGLALD